MNNQLIQKLLEEDLFQPPSDREAEERDAKVKQEKEERLKRVKELYKSIPFKDLEKKISDLLGTPITLEVELGSPGRNYGEGSSTIRFAGTQELVSSCGILQSVLKSVQVSSFGSSSLNDLAENNAFWATVHLNYAGRGGGTNGLEFLTVWYSFEEKKWTYRIVGGKPSDE